MGTYQSAGLYQEERSASAGPVAAVSTSTYATAGWLQKGPVNQAQLVTGFDNFVSQFGSYWRNSYIPFIMAAFFQNEGALAYVTRVVPSDATKAQNASGLDAAASVATFYSRQLSDPVTDLDATHYNINMKVDANAAADVDVTGDLGVAGSYALSALAGVLSAITDLTVTVEAVVGGGNRLKFVGAAAGVAGSLIFADGATNNCIEELLGLAAGGTYTYNGEDAIDWTLEAKWQGAWYNKSAMLIEGNDSDDIATGGWNSYNIEMQEESAVGAADWTSLESYSAVTFDDDTADQFAPTVINDSTNEIVINEGASYGTPRELKAYARTNECVGEGDAAQTSFSGTLLYPAVEEDTLSIVVGGITATDDGNGALTGTGVTSGTINYTTGAWTLVLAAAPAAGALLVAAYTSAPSASAIRIQLSGGTDGTAVARADVSDPALEATKAGIYAFNDVEEILQLSLPDFAGDVAVSNDLIAYADNDKFRFVLLTTALGVTPQNAVKFVKKTAQYNTTRAALYYPWVTIADPLTTDNRPLNIPPDGFIAGVYARTDSQRNVGKAPAGINDGRLVGAIGLERTLSKGERDILYPARINPLVSGQNTGLAVWGARTLSKDAEWKYIQTRRLFMFCEKSIENASYWVVFENNGPATWSKMLVQGNGFFTNIFRDGYLAGTTPSDGFKIVIDSSNNPQSAIDAGLLTADYYIAGNKPGEFVRLRFQQKVQAAA